MSIQSYKRVNERIMIEFSKRLVGCDFDIDQDEKDLVQFVKSWLRENDTKIIKIIKETTGEN